MSNPMSLRVVLAIVLAVAIPGLATAQNTRPPIDEDEVIRVSSRLIVVPVSVVNPNGDPVPGLGIGDFRLLEENRVQAIDSVVTADSVPVDIALLFDVSASTDRMFKFQQETAAKFLNEVMRADDRATIYSVGIKPRLLVSRATSQAAIDNIFAIPLDRAKEPTAFFDSVSAAAEHLNANSPPGRRRVMVVISDGEDNFSTGVQRAVRAEERKIIEGKASRRTTDEIEQIRTIVARAQQTAKVTERVRVLRNLQDADIVLYSINPAGSSFHLNEISIFGQENMQKFADETGGTAFLPKFMPIDTPDQYQNANNTRQNTDILERIFRQLTSELRAQYLVQYYSDSDHRDGKFVRLSVTLSNGSGNQIRARQGYYVRN